MSCGQAAHTEGLWKGNTRSLSGSCPFFSPWLIFRTGFRLGLLSVCAYVCEKGHIVWVSGGFVEQKKCFLCLIYYLDGQSHLWMTRTLPLFPQSAGGQGGSWVAQAKDKLPVAPPFWEHFLWLILDPIIGSFSLHLKVFPSIHFPSRFYVSLIIP